MKTLHRLMRMVRSVNYSHYHVKENVRKSHCGKLTVRIRRSLWSALVRPRGGPLRATFRHCGYQVCESCPIVSIELLEDRPERGGNALDRIVEGRFQSGVNFAGHGIAALFARIKEKRFQPWRHVQVMALGSWIV
ncbi:hypothetical protein [Mesorhizobium captivum]|uniref:hypothetical protein n=1 Tax=Mesorhizobium captivum TaxID=3072319 RepID=UPI002A23BDBF|nr:hypothetical protein [Mesorhizobium sp. VK23E]MDX8513570.1 hypothetical protein [Mesorhizobium sp. VK23E]